MSPQDLLSRFVSICSMSKEEGEAADFVYGLLEEWGGNPQRNGHNVWAEVGEAGPRILLNSHLDTVPVGEGWSSDPWNGEWQGGRLTALGANDAKGCGAALLCAFHQVIQNQLAHGRVMIALTAEEEIGGAGGIGPMMETWGEFDAAIVGEPTGMEPCTAQRGMLLLTCTAEGKTAHVAHPEEGENAVAKAARDVARLHEMSFEPHVALGTTRPQVTKIEGGIALNQIPDRCSFHVDLRTTPNLDSEEVTARIKEELESEAVIRSDRYEPKETAEFEPIVQAAIEASDREPVGSVTVSDWAFLGDIPAVKMGPGDTLRSHTPNEYLLESELLEAVEIYERTIRLWGNRARG